MMMRHTSFSRGLCCALLLAHANYLTYEPFFRRTSSLFISAPLSSSPRLLFSFFARAISRAFPQTNAQPYPKMEDMETKLKVLSLILIRPASLPISATAYFPFLLCAHSRRIDHLPPQMSSLRPAHTSDLPDNLKYSKWDHIEVSDDEGDRCV